MTRLLFLLFLCIGPNSTAAELLIRVVDVGAGECVVVRIPGPHYIIYDAGNWEDRGKTAMDAIRKMIPAGSAIDLLMLSHTDSDHIAAVPDITAEYRVQKIIHPTIPRTSETWRKVIAAIQHERDQEGCVDVDLATSEFPTGASYRYGDAVVVLVAGFNEPPAAWGRLDDSERMNAGSIVMRLLYGGKSVLFAGDAVGRHIGDPPESCIAMERHLVDSADVVPIDSDVLIAPHHGADNGSSLEFIRAVSPEYVIFPAGHKFSHPRQVTAARYLSAGVRATRMYRTDRGDDEGPLEWSRGGVPRNVDRRGDDDVVVGISDTGKIKVRYSR